MRINLPRWTIRPNPCSLYFNKASSCNPFLIRQKLRYDTQKHPYQYDDILFHRELLLEKKDKPPNACVPKLPKPTRGSTWKVDNAGCKFCILRRWQLVLFLLCPSFAFSTCSSPCHSCHYQEYHVSYGFLVFAVWSAHPRTPASWGDPPHCSSCSLQRLLL